MSSLEVKVDLPAGIIRLHRPEKRNALTRELLAELVIALDDLHQERKVRAIVLTGAGSAFCAGMDLAQMRDTAKAENPEKLWGQDARDYREVVDKMLRFPKPIIAAVNGPAVAGGAGLVLASDIVVATGDARFGLPEPRRGIVAGLVAPLISFRVGGGQAARLLLTGMLIEAAEAYRIGIYHELADDEQLTARAAELAEECAANAPQALQLTKRMLNETIGEQLDVFLSAGAATSATARTTEAAEEGLAAFLEKREPNWE